MVNRIHVQGEWENAVASPVTIAANEISNISIEEAKAIARIRDASPDLLAALEAIADHLEFGDSRKDAPFIASARAAIAKAKGA